MKRQTVLAVAFACISSLGVAQEIETTSKDQDQQPLEYQNKKNIVKLSLTSLAFGNYQFQYERVLNKTFSVGISYATIPKDGIPFGNTIKNLADDDPDLINIIDNGNIGYTSFTPEIRIYTGKKGFGKGFYLAPFFRASKYTFDNISFEYDIDGGGTASLSTNGTLKANSFGLLLGSQFNLGKSIVLDWWIMGPHYGTSDGDLTGVSSETLSQTEQDALRDTLNDIDIPLVDIENNVNANGAEILISGPWAGVRAGLSIGYRF
tara:strand:+ start:502 stop:1290 length:789 start_codon:yes stop_codon:yes gene_type:complete